nr:PREDICTED: uncharacterized protein LOC105678306 [Linepithema humile]
MLRIPYKFPLFKFRNSVSLCMAITMRAVVSQISKQHDSILSILGLLEIAIFMTASCSESGSVMRHQTIKRDDIPRVKIRVFRGPTEEKDDKFFTTWGYWIQQPSR